MTRKPPYLTTEEEAGAGARAAVEALPRLRLYVRDPYEPAQFVDSMPGRWVGIPNWPKASADYRRALDSDDVAKSPFVETFHFTSDKVLTPSAGATESSLLPIEPHKLQGVNCGAWLSFGWNDLPGDQAVANQHSLSFTSPPLKEDISLSGFGTAILRLRAETEGRYSIAVRLSHLHANGTSLRITYGLLNLAQWEGNRRPRKAFPGNSTLTVPVELNVAGYMVPKGDRLVLSVSPSYFPTMYTPAHIHGLAMDPKGSRLVLQTLPPEAFQNQPAFAPPRPLLALEAKRISEPQWENSYNEEADGKVRFRLYDNRGDKHVPLTGVTTRETDEDMCRVSADLRKTKTIARRRLHYSLDQPPLNLTVLAVNELVTEEDGDFVVKDRLETTLNDILFFEKSWEYVVPREWV